MDYFVYLFVVMFSDICRELGFTLSEKAYAYDFDESDVQNIIEDCDVQGFMLMDMLKAITSQLMFLGKALLVIR